MGDRVSIQFVQHTKNWEDKPVTYKSVVLFHHWGGDKFPSYAKQWLDDHNNRLAGMRESSHNDPIWRMDPNNLMLQFIRHMSTDNSLDSTFGMRVNFENYNYIDRPDTRPVNPLFFTGSLYLGADENSGDNSDNGHHEILVPEPTVYVRYKYKSHKDVGNA